ncbi:MAG: DUF2298 domain-containing protein [Deltaproteobacteria bacterium]|nr:DUF2298 domain-containing protein [Deltaproteobacteria bacterium]
MKEILVIIVFLFTLGFSIKNIFPSTGLVTSMLLGKFLLTIFTYYFALFLKLPPNLVFLLTILSIVLAGALRYQTPLPPVKSDNGLLFVLSLFLFGFYQSLAPEIHWGEKYGEFAILHFLSRFPELPAKDPWAFPNQLNYYYLHYYFWALLIKTFQLEPAVVFNIAVCSVPAFVFSAYYEIFRSILSSKRLALFLSSLCLLPNFASLRLFFASNKDWNFDTFWETTRTFPNHLFAEFPLWSFIFGDLHPHYMNYTGIALVLALGTKLFFHRDLSAFYIACFVAGSMIGFNSWDLPPLCIFLGLVFFRDLFKKFYLIPALISSVLFITSFLSFYLTISGKRINWGILHAEETMSFWHVFQHFGLFFVLNTFYLAIIALRTNISFLFLSFILGAIPAYLGHLGVIPIKPDLTFFISFNLVLSIICVSKLPDQLKFGVLCWISGHLVLLITETIFIADRMNTVFKMYSFIWFAFSLSLSMFIKHGIENLKHSLLLFTPFYAVFLLNALVLLFVMADHSFERGERPSLRGDLFLLNDNFKRDGEAVFWLKSKLDTQELSLGTVVEATSDSYRGTNFFSAFVGLPTVIGWWHHAGVRGTSQEDIEKRKDLVQSFYRNPDENKLQALKFYGVKYIFLGKIEKELYGSSLVHFESPNFKKIFDNGYSLIFEVLD